MSWLTRGRGLSIFGRTFALMFVALLVAEGIGLALLVTRPPVRNAPLQLSDIARILRRPPLREAGGPPPFGAGPEDRAPFREPPAGRDGPPRGPPPGGRLGPPGPPGNPNREWTLREAATGPAAPKDVDVPASEALRAVLASFLGTDPERVRLFVTQFDSPGPAPGDADFGGTDPQLGEGFLAALRLNDGRWRILASVTPEFPTEFQKQALLLFALGLLVLLPLAWIFAHALAAPIRRFADAARRLGSDANAPPLQRDGPAEMVAAIDAFNSMQARLNRLLQERSHMMGAIAHDLRTPLTRLAFRLDDLQTPLKEKVEADIHEMKLMISAALDFLRDRSLGAQRERLDLRLLVESVVDDQTDVGHDVKLEAGESMTIEGDPVALRRVVVNLVDNALKYGERARLRLRADGGECTIEIDDDGPGIPEPLQQRVFEPFFRAETSRNRDTGGIGLGLAAVRAIVLDHGGNISLRNRKDGGLRVAVGLPMPDR